MTSRDLHWMRIRERQGTWCRISNQSNRGLRSDEGLRRFEVRLRLTRAVPGGLESPTCDIGSNRMPRVAAILSSSSPPGYGRYFVPFNPFKDFVDLQRVVVTASPGIRSGGRCRPTSTCSSRPCPVAQRQSGQSKTASSPARKRRVRSPSVEDRPDRRDGAGLPPSGSILTPQSKMLREYGRRQFGTADNRHTE